MINNLNKPKIIVILGPTASGKSDLAVKLALKFNGEIISADSRQVYKGLDVGTGKITKKEMRGVPHHMLDVANPKRQYTVAEYKKEAEKIIEKILETPTSQKLRGAKKIPIICGGTGFYIQALVDGIILPEVEPDANLRKKLEKKSALELFEMLEKIDPEKAKKMGQNNSDKNNKVRLIRAIEIAKHLGKNSDVKVEVPKYNALKIGIIHNPSDSPYFKGRVRSDDLPSLKVREGWVGYDKLRKRINKRLINRIDQKNGMIQEAKKLHKKGLSYKRMRNLGLEYKALADFLENRITKKEMISRLQTEIWQYSRRQMTWFRRDEKIIWLKPKIRELEKEVRKFL